MKKIVVMAMLLLGLLVSTSFSDGSKGYSLIPDCSVSLATVKKDIAASYKQTKALLAAGKDMERLRSPFTPSCMDGMHYNKPRVEPLIEKLDSLPKVEAVHRLAVASINLRVCTTCSSGAFEWCDMAEKELERAKSSMKDIHSDFRYINQEFCSK